MNLKPTLRLLAVLLVSQPLAAASAQANPNLWVEAPSVVEVDRSFRVRVSADRPVTFTLTYGDWTVERVDQRVDVQLTARADTRELSIEATDRDGRTTLETVALTPVPPVEPRWVITGGANPGDPFTVSVRFEQEQLERLGQPELLINGNATPLLQEGGIFYAFGVAPLRTEAAAVPIELRWGDETGGRSERRTVEHGPLEGEVQTLQLSGDVLSAVTPEARELEAAALARARANLAPEPKWHDAFLLPIEGRGTSGFARSRRYAPGGRVSFHLGEDIAAPTGTPIRATNDGTVVLVGQYPIKGGLTVIDHGGGVTSRYYHQSRMNVSEGQTVQRGDVIGEVGSTGLSTGPHLHWEVRVHGTASNPLAWVNRMRP
jgi:hypothetical protein